MSASIEEHRGLNALTDIALAHEAHSEAGDGSSSLSDIEQEAEQDDDQDDDQDDLDDLDSDIDNESLSDENDSEAETERLENSPHKQRANKDVVLNSQSDSHTYERNQSKLHSHFTAEHDNDDDGSNLDELSDDDLSPPDSPRTTGGDDGDDAEQAPRIATTSLEDSSVEANASATFADNSTKKRKRSQLAENGLIDAASEVDEPARKRTGSVGTRGDEYAIDDAQSLNGDAESPHNISGQPSDAGAIQGQDDQDAAQQEEQEVANEEATEDQMDLLKSPGPKSDRIRRRKSSVNGVAQDLQDAIDASDQVTAKKASNTSDDGEELEDTVEADVDDIEAAIKNEEEQEKKRLALQQLHDIEQHFSSFRDRLHEERLAKLNHEEWMLKQDPPIHPEYLAMMRCIDARRDEKLRIERRLAELKRETLQRSAVAKRSQILSQFYQDVRDIREKKLELLGKQWYEIQHDRRGYGSNVEDYTLKYPVRRSDQLKQQYAYNTEVSVLSGIAKYRGFPAAPPMAPATASELEEDFKKMGKTHPKQPQRVHPSVPLQDLAALRAATSAAILKPAEEQFIEQTPWANPQHPSHAHLLQRQASAQHAARTASPFSMPLAGQARRHSHQANPNVPISGTFSGVGSSIQPQSNGVFLSGATKPPTNPFGNQAPAQKAGPILNAPLQTSLSPQLSRQMAGISGQLGSHENKQDLLSGRESAPSMAGPNINRDASGFSFEGGVTVKREQQTVTNGRF